MYVCIMSFEFLNLSEAKLKQIMTTYPRGCWCLPQKYFKTENIDCFELEVTAAKDVGRFKLLCKTENFKEKKTYYFSQSVFQGPLLFGS